MTEATLPLDLTLETAPAAPRLTRWIKATAGAGQLVESVSTSITSTFLFFFYTAVMGLPGSLVGAATAVALAIDAIADPLLGSLSDNSRSRWGKRVPFLLIGAPLVALGVGLMFSPPRGLTTWPLFGWLIGVSLLMRFAVSTFHVPFLALGAELTGDYAGRSSVVAWRTLFSIFGPLVLIVLAYGVFLSGKLGLGNVRGYAPLGWTAAAIVAAGGLLAAVGVRRYAGALPVAARSQTALHRRLLTELVEIFRNPSFRIMFSCSVLFYAAQGMAAALTQHMFRFVWKINSAQILIISLNIFAGLLVGVPMAPMLSRPLRWRGLLLISPVLGLPIALALSLRLGLPVALPLGLGIGAILALALSPRWRPLEKRTTLILGLAMFCLAQGGLSGLRALGLYTATGATAVGPIAVNTFMAGIGLAFVTIAIGSMMADASDEHDLLFGVRREGMYFAGLGFAAKAATGVGALLAGAAIDIIRFPAAAAAAGAAVRLTPQMLDNLAWASGPCAAAVSFVGTCFFFFYRIDRKRHAEIAAALAARKG